MVEKLQELLMSVRRFALLDDLASGDIQGCEQGQGAVADVVMGLNSFEVASAGGVPGLGTGSSLQGTTPLSSRADSDTDQQCREPFRRRMGRWRG